MKIILILMIGLLSLSSMAQAKECKLRLTRGNSNSLLSIIKSNDYGNEVPEGKCKFIKPEIMRESNFTCEEAHAALTAADSRLAKKYGCYQPALGTARYEDNGVPVTSTFAICYICQTPKEEKKEIYSK